MIETINSGKYINVQQAFTRPPNISPGSSGAGMIRWNPNMQCFEVNDGAVWQQYIMASPTIELNTEAQELLDYVKKLRDRQRLVEQNPSLEKALEAITRAEDNFNTLAKLVDNKPIDYHHV
jgi:hypothetical protein